MTPKLLMLLPLLLLASCGPPIREVNEWKVYHSVNAEAVIGAIDPLITQASINETICTVGYTKIVRPPTVFTEAIKEKRMINLQGTKSDYELDHWVPLEVGGCSGCTINLVMVPYSGSYNAHDKAGVENWVHEQVCTGKMSLIEGQAIFLNNMERWKDYSKITLASRPFKQPNLV